MIPGLWPYILSCVIMKVRGTTASMDPFLRSHECLP